MTLDPTELVRTWGVSPFRSSDDCSKFISDVSIPDGIVLRPVESVLKAWLLENCGTVEWKDRSLRRVERHDNPQDIGSPELVRIPDTKPGEQCLVQVMIITPAKPGSYQAHWKMTDADGKLFFPDGKSIWAQIVVVNEELGSKMPSELRI